MNGKTLRKYREAAGLTQEELAEMLEVTQHRISLWENDRVKINKFKGLAFENILTVIIAANNKSQKKHKKRG